MTSAAQLVTPPIMGRINAIAISGTATAALPLIDDSIQPNDNRATYWALVSDTRFGIIFGRNAAELATAPDLAAVAGDARCWSVEPGVEFHVYAAEKTRYFRVVGEAAGILRWYNS